MNLSDSEPLVWVIPKDPLNRDKCTLGKPYLLLYLNIQLCLSNKDTVPCCFLVCLRPQQRNLNMLRSQYMCIAEGLFFSNN